MEGVRPAVAVRRAAQVLADAGVDAPYVDASLLVAYVLGVPRGRLALARQLDADDQQRLDALVARRARREPLQHLTGEAGFGPLTLAVGPGVFVPRPETEALALWAASRAGGEAAGGEVVVVDLAAGSGPLALVLAHWLPRAQVYAVERSPAALAWLRRNVADRAAAGDRPVTVVPGDATDPAVLAELDGTVDLVVSNPPYVPVGAPVPEEVSGHDPAQAVFAGEDGLAVLRPLVARAAGLLRPGGMMGVEHDERQGDRVAALCGRWCTEVTTRPDLAGRPRFTTGRRRRSAGRS